jgi:raffinose/stachyose/melibiose transport system substrate-binding protein
MKRFLLMVSIALILCVSTGFAAGQKAGSGESTTVTFLTWNYADRQKSTDLWIQRCKELYNIAIDMQNTQPSNYSATLATRAAANDLPDLVNTHGIDGSLIMFTDGGFKVEPDTFIDVSDIPGVANFNQEILAKRRINGKLYYVPIATQVHGVLYNKKIFSDNKLSIPANKNEFIALMDKIKALGIAPLAGSFGEAWSAQIIPMIGYAQLVESVDPDIGRKLYDPVTNISIKRWSDLGSPIITALSFIRQWIAAGYFTDDPLGSNATVAAQMLATGRAAMFITGTWEISVAKAAAPAGTEIGYFPLPLNAPGESIYIPTIADEGFCINARGKNLEASKKAMEVFYSVEIQQATILDMGGIPTHKGVVITDPFIQDVVSALNKYKTGGVMALDAGGGRSSRSSFDLEIESQSVAAGIITPQQFLAKLDATNAEAGAIMK